MWRASEEFELERYDFDDDDLDMGIWDGEKFLLEVRFIICSHSNFLTETAACRPVEAGISMNGGTLSKCFGDTVIMRRPGHKICEPTICATSIEHYLHLLNFRVKAMIEQFIQLYTPEAPRWDTISSLASSFGWTDMVAQTTSEYLETHGVSPKFTREFVEAATRVNYGQNVDRIHALEGACSMAATGASSIKGGNYQIFQQFLIRSKANLFLNTTVRSSIVHIFNIDLF